MTFEGHEWGGCSHSGRLFHMCAIVTPKEQLPVIRSHICGTVSCRVELDRSRWRDSNSSVHQKSLVRHQVLTATEEEYSQSELDAFRNSWPVHYIMFLLLAVVCSELLHSSQLDVSYFAAGVVAHLLTDESTRLMLSDADVHELRTELVSVIILFDVILWCVQYS